MDIDTRIQDIVTKAIEAHVFPGAVIGYIAGGQSHVLPFGRLTYDQTAEAVTADTVYDLASVTKAIPTSSIILHLMEHGLLSADDQVRRFIPELSMPGADDIQVKHLLTFTVEADLPKRLGDYAPEGGDAILKTIFNAPLKYPPGQRYVYSNVPYLLLGIVAERVLGKPLDRIADELFFMPLHMTSTSFHPKTLHKSIAPTEINDRGTVHGEVHDESTWAFYQDGQIIGHAGLFSTAGDLLIFGQMLLSGGTYNGRQYFSPETVATMSTEVLNDGTSGMSLGWEMSRSDYMSPRISKRVFGKTGFTGTLFLLDPDKQRCLVVLSNRTYPHRPENSDAVKAVERALQDLLLVDG